MKSTAKDLAGAVLAIAAGLALSVVLIGWLMNLVKLFLGVGTAAEAELILRLAGVVIPIIGALYGFM